MPDCPIDNVALLLPHSGHMVLLDRVLHYDAQSLHAVTTLKPGCLLLPPGADALPVWMGAEILAQGIGAWAGAQALDRGEPVRLGFLLGSRKLDFGAPAIPLGEPLDVRILLSLQDALGMGVFDCTLACGETTLIHGAMNVFSPTSEQQLQSMLNGTAS